MTTRRVLLQELIQDAEGRKESARQQLVTEDHLIKVLREQLAAAPLTEETVELPAKQSRMSDGSKSLPEIMAIVMRENPRISTPHEIVAALEERGISSDAKRGLLANVFSSLGRRKDLFARLGRGHYAIVSKNGQSGVK